MTASDTTAKVLWWIKTIRKSLMTSFTGASVIGMAHLILKRDCGYTEISEQAKAL